MNRRVVLAVTDGTGKLIKEGGIGDVVQALHRHPGLMKKQQECCDQILKRLDKLDDILAALKDLQGENDRLKGELADLRNQQNALQGPGGRTCPSRSPSSRRRTSPTPKPWARWTKRRSATRNSRCWA